MNCDRLKAYIAAPKRASCPRCGAPNNCAIENGKSYSACWCMSLPKVESVSGDTCLCKKCLTEAISPCNKTCKLDESGLSCESCKRSVNQIKNWKGFTLEERLDIIDSNS